MQRGPCQATGCEGKRAKGVLNSSPVAGRHVLLQGGDPTGTGKGGKSIYNTPNGGCPPAMAARLQGVAVLHCCGQCPGSEGVQRALRAAAVRRHGAPPSPTCCAGKFPDESPEHAGSA